MELTMLEPASSTLIPAKPTHKQSCLTASTTWSNTQRLVGATIYFQHPFREITGFGFFHATPSCVLLWHRHAAAATAVVGSPPFLSTAQLPSRL